MGEMAKWAILAAIIITIVSLCVAFPITQYMNLGVYTEGIAVLVNYAGNAFIFARGLINNFLSPWGRAALTGLMIWLIGKWLLTYSLKVLVWVYHWLFK